MFSCALCSRTFVARGALTSHTKIHTKEKPHKCLICSATFGHANNLKIHVKCVHNGHKIIKNKNFHCPLCSYKCYSNIMLQIHLRKHSDHVPFSCNVSACGFKTKYEQSLKQHVQNVHKDERPFECPSEGCSYKCKTRGGLKLHLSVHSSEKQFACKVPGCHYTCKRKSYLISHTARAHSDEKPFKCSLCDFQAKTKSELYQHQFRHTQIKRFQCQAPNCGFASSLKSALDLHFDSKHRTKDVLCTEPTCSYRCGSIALLKRHLRRHRFPMLRCPRDSCNFITKFKCSLLNHISHCPGVAQSATVVGPRIFNIETIRTTGTMETLHCSLPDCGYQTKFQHHLDRHRITHNKEEKREHVCTFCFYRCSHLCTLKAHVQRHFKEKPFSCLHCKYAAVSSIELRHHAANIHHIHVVPRGEKDEARKCGTCYMSFWSYTEFVLHSMIHLQPFVVLERLRINVT